MNEDKFEISVNQEDVQNIINCYEKDIKYIEQLEDNWNKLKEWLEEGKKVSSEQDNRIGYNFTTLVLDKMQEIENGGMNE